MNGLEIFEFMITESLKALKNEFYSVTVIESGNFVQYSNAGDFANWIIRNINKKHNKTIDVAIKNLNKKQIRSKQ